MATTAQTEPIPATSRGVAARPARRRTRWPIFPLGIVVVFIVMAIFAPLVAPYSPYAQNLDNRLFPPAFLEGGRPEYLLGTDKLGRDLLSRIIFGARVAFEVSLAGLLLGGVVGGVLGVLAGYKGGRFGDAIMAVVDGTFSFPIILLALLLAITMGPGMSTVLVALGIVMWASFARLVRGEVLGVKEKDWVIQAHITGCSDLRIMLVHIVPHILNTWVVVATLQMGTIILFEASLSFLGAGIPPPTPAWGQMVAEGRDLVSDAWWLSIIPGVCIMLMVLAFNLLGDWLREVLDPKLRQV